MGPLVLPLLRTSTSLKRNRTPHLHIASGQKRHLVADRLWLRALLLKRLRRRGEHRVLRFAPELPYHRTQANDEA